MTSTEEIQRLQAFARDIRYHALSAITSPGAGHVGGVLSVVETLAVLYGSVMNINVENPRWEDRDWLICSKGHAGPAVYAALALKGFIELDELKTLNGPGTRLPSHCDRNKTPGIDITTGSLGQGTSQAVGVAMGNRLDGRSSYTYLIVGDGELQEGQCWEAFLCAAQQKLDKLILFVDYNKKQLDGWTKDINDVGDVKAKLEAFGWYAREIDGHDIGQLLDAIDAAKAESGRPHAIVLNTIKGRGWSRAENEMNNHSMTVKVQDLDGIHAELFGEVQQ